MLQQMTGDPPVTLYSPVDELAMPSHQPLTVDAPPEIEVRFWPPLFEQRRGWVLDVLRREAVTSVSAKYPAAPSRRNWVISTGPPSFVSQLAMLPFRFECEPDKVID